jgi:hypothetical protein
MKTLPVLIIVAALLAALALPALADGTSPLQGFRVHVGWVDPQDFDNTVVFGGDYIWQNALATVNYFDSSGEGVTDFEGDWLYRAPTDASVYAGVGVGLGFDDDSNDFLGNILVGKEFWPNNKVAHGVPYVEARYTFGGNLDEGSQDGIRLVAGWRF